MSRWGRGRGGSVAVPLDSALFRENSNCPSATRLAGTVGKWGITSFTSIRSAPYAFNNVVKKPVQDQNSPLTVPAVETEQPPPKPKKFFKSRNTEPFPPVPQITYAPPVSAAPLSPEYPSNSKEKKTKRTKSYNRDSSSPEPPRYRASEKTKARKNSVATKAAKKEDPSDETKPPNKRYLVRNRNKVINYAEDGSNSPIPDLSMFESEIPPKVPSPKPSPSISSPSYVKPDIVSPSSKDSAEDRKPPPIVLRMSKGTYRIVSTDSNEGFTSPGSDRHSSLDTHSDFAPDLKKSPSMEAISSPKHEGLKITIKCSNINQEISKKEKKKEKKDGHKSHKRHHKNSDDEPLKKPSSPQPGSDAYDLYKTLASPVPEETNKQAVPVLDEIESQLAKLDSAGPAAKSPRIDSSTEPPPEPKPPEGKTGRSRRNRPNINYNENDDYLDAVTAKRIIIKPVVENKKETRKGRRRNEPVILEIPPEVPDSDDNKRTESPEEPNDLINILSNVSENSKSENEPIKLRVSRKKQKYPSKQSSPECHTDNSQEMVIDESVQPNMEPESRSDDIAQASSPLTDEMHSQPVQSPVSDYNNMSNTPEESNNAQGDVFKPPQLVSDSESHTEEKLSVKLVITKKKGSIFKSKSLVNDNPSPLPARKRRHLYRHEWANDKGNETPRREPENSGNAETNNTATHVPEELTRVTRYRKDDIMDDPTSDDTIKPYTSVKCAKEAKEYYTVVRNVKKAHQIQEIGEFQEFNDDVEYLLDALQDNNPMSTRCLSAITLASKCTAPAFRMHLRAHGAVQKFFSALHDATNDQSLGLCTATVMFVLSQDRLNMDLDKESLELMLNLLESDVSHKNALDDCGLTSAQLAKTQERVRELCAEIKSQGKATHLDLDNITVGHLAMETLLSLTSKRAGEWFKEELRALGGLAHIVRTMRECVCRLPAATAPGESQRGWTPTACMFLRKAERCMRVLENVTQHNEENQLYLVSGESEDLPRLLASLLALCIHEAKIAIAPPADAEAKALNAALLDGALPAIKVLVNLAHSFGNTPSLGSDVVGQELTVMETCLEILDNQNNFIPEGRNFEFSVCVLLLIINLVQNNPVNTRRLQSVRRPRDPFHLIVDHFYKREELAKRAEENTDALLDGKKDAEDEKDKKKQTTDDFDETVAKLLARAGMHMEHTMVGAYTALALGHSGAALRLKADQCPLRAAVPRFAPLLPTLRKYYDFLALTASAEAQIVSHVKATHLIIQYMEETDKELDELNPEPPVSHPAGNMTHNYYQTSPSDMPQDMSINNRTYNSIDYTSSSSERMSSSMEMDSYR